MSNKRRLLELERENPELIQMLEGSRKENDKLYSNLKDVSAALIKLENLFVLRAWRWLFRKSSPSDIMYAKWVKEAEVKE